MHIQMRVVETRSTVRDRLRTEGLDERFGGINRFRSVAEVVEEFERENSDLAKAG
jgi:hypothetical protein